MSGTSAISLVPGLVLYPSKLDRAEQEALLSDIRAVTRAAPLFTPRMPKTGKPFSVRMTNCGPLGWVSDSAGYRYQALHPETGAPWPPMPAMLCDLWSTLVSSAVPPEACLVNYYDTSARMGLHQDRDEQDFSMPVLSVSLGDSCLFRFGAGQARSPTRSVHLHSGDVLVMGGPARLCFHGVDRIFAGEPVILDRPGRINLTLRRVFSTKHL